MTLLAQCNDAVPAVIGTGPSPRRRRAANADATRLVPLPIVDHGCIAEFAASGCGFKELGRA